jgi:hypothetical protein
MATGNNITREVLLKTLKSKGMFFSLSARTFECRYCRKVIKSDKTWMADRHLGTVVHNRNVTERNTYLQT